MPRIGLLRAIEDRLLEKEKIAIFFYGREYSSKEIVERYRSVARFLAGKGIRDGDVVAVDLLNRPELLFIFMGSWLAGATVTPINIHLKEDEISYQLQNSNAKVVIAESALAERVDAAVHKAGLKIMKFTLDFDNAEAGTGEYSRMFFNNSTASPEAKNPDDLFIIYTSGTTGKPKGAVLTSENIFMEALQLQQVVNLQETDRMLIILPLFHVNNLMFSISTLMKGGSLIILKKFDVVEFFKYSRKYKPTMFSGVPTVYKMLTDSWTLENNNALKSIQVGICGAAPMPVRWFEDFEKAYRIKIIEGYGLTEGTVASTINPRFGTRKIGSIGIPFPGQDVRIFSEHDEDLSPGEVGEIVVRGPNVMKGYLDAEDETNETLRNGWLHTGDLGYVDYEGYFYIVDRKKDMIIRGGENVYPKEIENVISSIPGVSEAAVVARPDNVYGEEVVAFVVRKYPGLTERNVIDHCKKSLAWYKCPKEVHFVQELPKNSVGKIQKSVLRKSMKETLQ